MIRVVDIGTQLNPDEEDLGHRYAFFDTVTNRFLEFGAERVQVFDVFEFGDMIAHGAPRGSGLAAECFRLLRAHVERGGF